MQSPGRAIRALVFLAGLTLSLGFGVLGTVKAMEAAELGKPAINLNIADVLERRLPELAAQRETARGPLYQLVVLGDSTVVSYPRGKQVPDRLEEALARRLPRGPEVAITNLAVSGVATFDYYFLLDEIILAAPDAVVISFNFDTLSRVWVDSYARPELAGLVAPSRVLSAAQLPLRWVGLSFDRLLFYVGTVQLGAYEPWARLTLEQARMGRAREAARDFFDDLAGSSSSKDLDQAMVDDLVARLFLPDQQSTYFRFNEQGQRDHYGTALDGVSADHPVLQALAATLRTLENAGVPSFVYLTPINVAHVRYLDIDDPNGLRASSDAIRRVVTQAGADFIDLHDLLPDAAYRDAGGHFTVEGEYDGPALLAEAIAPALLESLQAHVFRSADALTSGARD